MLETFCIEPTVKQRGTVIWMHGLGASNHDFDDVVPELNTPYLRFVFPAAPVRRVTVNGGMPMPAWYDIVTWDDPPLRERTEDVLDAANEVQALIAAEVARGIPSNRIVVAGFSQGGAMALHCGLRQSQALAGVLVLSAYMLQPDTFESERNTANQATPFLFCHGQFDQVVPFALGKKAHAQLDASGYNVDWRSFPMQHSLCLPEVDAIHAWLERIYQE